MVAERRHHAGARWKGTHVLAGVDRLVLLD